MKGKNDDPKRNKKLNLNDLLVYNQNILVAKLAYAYIPCVNPLHSMWMFPLVDVSFVATFKI